MIARLLAVRPGEGRTFLRLALHFFLILAGTTFYLVSAEGLFIASYPPRMLPYVYLGGAVLGSLAALAQERLRPRLGGGAVAVGLAALLLALRAALWLRADVGPFLFLLAAPAFGIVLGIENAILVQAALDPRAARRLLPGIGAIGGVGPVAAGLLVGALSPKLGAPEMAWPAAACILISIACLGGAKAPRTDSRRGERGGSLLRHRFALLLLSIVFAAGVLATLTRFQLGISLKASVAPERIASYLGLLNAALSAAAVLFQLALARWLISRLGVGATMAVYPAALAGAGAFLVAAPGVIASMAAAGVERLLRQNLLRPILQVAVMPLPDTVRTRTVTAVRGWLEPLAISATSLGIMAAGGWRGLAWLIPAAGAAALVAALTARGAYAREVTSALHARRLKIGEDPDQPPDLEARVRNLLHEQVGSELPVRTTLALQLLAGRCTRETVDRIRAAWGRWDAGLRVEAIRALGEDPVPEAVEFLRSLPATEPAQVRAGLLRARAWEIPEDELLRLLADPALGVGREAMARLIRSGRARPVLEEWIRSGRADLHAAAAYAIGFSDDDSLRAELPKLATLAPAEAIRASAQRPSPSLAETCVRALPDERAFAAARETLVALGPAARPALLAAVRDPARSAPAIQVLGEMRDPALLEFLSDPDEEIRYRSAKALAARGLESDGEREVVRAAMEAELAALDSVPTEDFDWAAERVFVLLSLLQPGPPFRRIYLSYVSCDSKQRGFALEALEEAVESDWRRRILPRLEERSSRVVEPPRGREDLAARLKATSLFRDWRLRDLEILAQAPAEPGPWIVFRDGEPLDLEATIVGRASHPPSEGAVPLASVYRTISARRRCGPLWLRALALRASPKREEVIEVSRSYHSLASRSTGDAVSESADASVWQRLFLLRGVPLFSGLSPDWLRLIAEIARPVSAAEGEIVVRERRPGHHFYVVCSGFLEVGAGGRQLAVLGEGDVFGELALLTGEARSATVRAMKRSEMLTIERTDFLDLVETHPSLVSALSVMISRRTT
ncbi:MAG: cyclic nucleotide-binding domain-containing protein [Planctomycetes bacterium]|nr:cyclic nucleotide-binding domain-containing protein [Planctomycetota bacterium]